MDNTRFLLIVIAFAAILVQANNFILENNINSAIQENKNISFSAEPQNITQGNRQLSLSDIIPSGTPEVYGTELGVSYDKPIEGLAILQKLDNQITLEGQLEERYIKIGTSISCEFCCDAKSITFADGKPACGCAHSFAMRGLAKYLLKNHGDTMTDQQILNELVKWKTLFFPKQMTERAVQLAADNGNFDQELLNKVNSSVPDMVGGC